MSSSTPTSNPALADEIEAIRAIFEPETIEITSVTQSATVLHLHPPAQPFTFCLSFLPAYPDVPPSVDGTASTGDTARGEGEHAVKLLTTLLGEVYRPGEVCLFDLISEVGPLLEAQYGAHTAAIGTEEGTSRRSGSEEVFASYSPSLPSSQPSNLTPTHTISSSISSLDWPLPLPQWKASAPLTVQKSTFIAHAAPCTSKSEALSHVAALVASSKKIATATHNISAFRIRQQSAGGGFGGGGASYVQDCDDDGETAAGGRLLHLLQLMECENVVVVVTRWFGGVKLGGERFRCIGNVAREALLSGGWGKEKGRK